MTGASGLGEGPQEEFYGCSDVKITGSGTSGTTFGPTVQTTSQTTSQTTKETTRVTSTPIVVSTTKVTQAPSSGSCYNGDGLYPDLQTGCKRFYQCVSGIIYYFNCPAGTLFDSKISACNYDYLVNC